MTTASDGARRPRLDGTLAWLTHASIWLGALAVLPDFLYNVTHPFSPPDNGWIYWVPDILLFSVYAGVYVHERRGMCVRCMEDVPADASVRATTEGGWDRRWLAYYHWNWRIFIGLFCVMMPLATWTKFYGLNGLWDVQIVLMITSWRYHRLLAPWCPWCHRRWGGGGDPELVPEPDPVMETERT